MTFLLFFIGAMILAPYIGRGLMWLLGFLARRHFEKKSRQMQDAFARAAGLDPEEERRKRAREKRTRSQGGWSTPAPRKKKIDPNDAEYIKFKEITVDETAVNVGEESGSGTRTTVTVEEQVTDVTWIDID